MVVENALGRLKGRWRCLLKQKEANIEQMNAAVLTCCVLHNICEMHRETLDANLIEQSQGDEEPHARDRNGLARAPTTENI